MKKIITLVFAVVFPAYLLLAQQPANPGFENWTQTTHYENPAGFVTSNQWTYQFVPMGNVKKVTGSHGLFGAELITAPDSTIGALIIGTPAQGGINGGIPYTGQPDSISAYVKYAIQANDTAFIIIGFKKSGVLMAVAVKYLTGAQATYKRISMPSNLPVLPAPDSLVVIISSSRLDPPKYPGSMLTIDSITFIGASQGLPNPSFETWVTNSSEEPNSWTTINFGANPTPSATKSTSSYTGTYALRLESIATSWGDTIGLITNGRFGDGVNGGMRVYANPMKLTGYYKYTAVGLDTALGGCSSYINTIKIDSGLVRLAPTNTYTYFEIPLTYNNWPYIDTFNIVFASGNINDSTNYVGLGSVLYIDELTIVYNPVGTGNGQEAVSSSAFPNPFRDMAFITFDNHNGINHELNVFDMIGNLVMKKENIISGNVMVQRSNLPSGIYQYTLREKQSGNISSSGKLVID